ncbi:prolipoprotein diacylglyceryl transferase family protein [Streptomyces chartreusis]|uniref:prolipoprotein diacylglyceryl transferase family protein n=1 Tax=Streptomyces chartreusis TaxID=1969 RepID=UPI0034382EB0
MRGPRWLGRRYLFSLAGLRVSSFAVMLYIGFVSGTAAGATITDGAGVSVTRFGVAAGVLLVPALAGARLWCALPRRARIGPGQNADTGLYGGLIASLVASPFVLAAVGLDFWRFWDGAAVILLVGMAVTRFGCLMSSCCAGRETQGFLGIWLPDHVGRWRRRYPTQLLEAAWSAAILVAELCVFSAPVPVAGGLFLSAAAAYGAGRTGLEMLREDASTRAIHTRMNLGFSAILVLTAAIILAVRWP